MFLSGLRPALRALRSTTPSRGPYPRPRGIELHRNQCLDQRSLLGQRVAQQIDVHLSRRDVRLQGQGGGRTRGLAGGETGRHHAQRAVRLVCGRDGTPGDQQVVDLPGAPGSGRGSCNRAHLAVPQRTRRPRWGRGCRSERRRARSRPQNAAHQRRRLPSGHTRRRCAASRARRSVSRCRSGRSSQSRAGACA